MIVVRPVAEEDFERLVDLANQATFGLTNLPKDPDLLRKRIKESLYGFQKVVDRPRGELYIFVMEDLDTGEVIGTSCIVSKVGGFEPFYAYRIEKCVHQSEMLGAKKEIATLHLVAEHSGPSEIGGLFLSPAHRRRGAGRLLSLFRFLFMAELRERFEPFVIAEMRGVVGPDGHSPFWEALGRHFFDMDYPKADLLSAMDKRFIADLMPTCPIYIPLLPKSAQKVIAEVHEQTRPALKMLQDEGFEYTGMVDIFEAGPLLGCHLERIRTVRESGQAIVAEITDKSVESVAHVIACFHSGFRACMGNVKIGATGRATLTRQVAQVLKLKEGDTIRFAPLRPLEPRKGN